MLGICGAHIAIDRCKAYSGCTFAVQLDESAPDSHYIAEVHFGAVDLEGFEEGSTETFRVSTDGCILAAGGLNLVIAVGSVGRRGVACLPGLSICDRQQGPP